jgi:hypothetical protein
MGEQLELVQADEKEVNKIKMNDSNDSLWIDTPRGKLHIFITYDGTWKMTAWNTAAGGKPCTITKNKKPGKSFYHLKQHLQI